MVSRILISFGFLVGVFFFLFSFSVVYACADSIVVSGYTPPRNRYGLAKPDGSPPNQFFMESFGLYSALLDPVNFSESGTVKCSVHYDPFVTYVSNGSLVDENGVKRFDVFFAGLIETNLSDEEATELAKFVNSGGILYISGENNTPYSGPAYNLLFEKLGINDRFDVVGVNPDGNLSISLAPENSTIVTNGPFTPVGSFKHDSYKMFNHVDTIPIVRTTSNNVIVAEKAFGAGYLSVTGATIYRDRFLGGTNMNYFLNLFALGCNRESMKILDVPSFKQGLFPYNNNSPAWEGEVYDDGDKQTLDCGDSMAECACALTSATMVAKYNGISLDADKVSVDPGTANIYFNKGSTQVGNTSVYRSFGYYNGSVRWNRLSDYSWLAYFNNKDDGVIQPKLELPNIESYDLTKVKSYIDQEVPVILKVTKPGFPVHWVVVKGYKGDELVINDPANADPSPGTYSTLSGLGYSVFSPSRMITYKQTNSDFSRFEVISREDVRILVTDSLGRRTGYDPETGEFVSEIPDSYYVFEEPYSDATGLNSYEPGNEGVYTLVIKTPDAGELNMQTFPQTGFDSSFTVFASSSEGDYLEQDFVVKAGSQDVYTFDYSPDPGETTLMELLDDFNRGYGKIGKNWKGETTQGDYRLIGDEVEVFGGPIYWKPGEFGVDQEAHVKLTRIDKKGHHSVLLKVQKNWKGGTVAVYYEALQKKVGIETYIKKRGWQTLAEFPMELVGGDTLGGRAMADGTVQAFVNGEVVGQAQAEEFFNNKGGSVGMWFMSTGWPHAILDDFKVGGNQ